MTTDDKHEPRKNKDLSKATPQKTKRYATASLFSMLMGEFGADRFYLGHTWLGILKLVTLGGLGLWAIIDMILVVTGKLRPRDNVSYIGYHENKKPMTIALACLVIGNALSFLLVAAMGGLMLLGQSRDPNFFDNFDQTYSDESAMSRPASDINTFYDAIKVGDTKSTVKALAKERGFTEDDCKRYSNSEGDYEACSYSPNSLFSSKYISINYEAGSVTEKAIDTIGSDSGEIQ